MGQRIDETTDGRIDDDGDGRIDVRLRDDERVLDVTADSEDSLVVDTPDGQG